MAELSKWLVTNATFAVALLLAIIALTIVLFGAIVTLWIKPKLALLDTMRTEMASMHTITDAHGLSLRINTIETKIAGYPDLNALKGLVDAMKDTLDKERVEQQKDLKRMRKIVLNTSANMRDLGRRSLEAGKEMIEARHSEYAREQAEQDVILSRTNMQLSRLTPEALPEATKLYEDAVARRDKLFAEAKLRKPMDDSFLVGPPGDDDDEA